MRELSLEVLQGIPKNGPTDPIEYYRRPLVGKLFRERINRGLRLLGNRTFDTALEVGYGAGAVMLSLSSSVKNLHGIDLDADPRPASELLKSRNIEAALIQGSVYELPYSNASFDLVVSFSTFEHLHDYPKALREVARVLKPGGFFLLGMPSVNRMMEAGFLAIGFKGINDHHVTTPKQVANEFGNAGFALSAADTLDVPLRVPLGLRLYHVWLLERKN
ncbi:MAG TPA: class I SAM-dependent methyltransferase [Polyangiaceae bacterium]|jgi:SAM-dependent methyltransferase|nr:class I SAM-dependent methyltransferase [Polyangiaceae bacterium]